MVCVKCNQGISFKKCLFIPVNQIFLMGMNSVTCKIQLAESFICSTYLKSCVIIKKVICFERKYKFEFQSFSNIYDFYAK